MRAKTPWLAIPAPTNHNDIRDLTTASRRGNKVFSMVAGSECEIHRTMIKKK
jgi:hypothetical protein